MTKHKYININNNEIYEDFEKKVNFLEELNQIINKEEEINLILKKIDEDLILLAEEILNTSPNIILLKEITNETNIEELREEIEKLNVLKVSKLVLGLSNLNEKTKNNYKNITKKIALDIISLIRNEKNNNNYIEKIEIVPIESWIIYSYITKILKRTGNEDKIESFISNIEVPELLKIVYKDKEEFIDAIEKIKLEILSVLEEEFSSDKFKEILDNYIENNLKIFVTEPNK